VLQLQCRSQEETLPWLELMVRETTLVWEHIKQEVGAGGGDSYRLPFGMALQPEVAIEGVPLRAGSGYLRFLKSYTHNLKFLVSFDFSVRLRT
jgi:hypothetical protein